MEKENLVLGVPIMIDGVGLLHQYTIEDIVKTLGFKLYEDYVSPFYIDIKMFDDESIQQQFTSFDLFFTKKDTHEFLLQYEGDMMFKLLLKSLSFFFKCNVEFLQFDETILLSNGGKIDKYNFDKVAEAILAINGKKREIPEKPPVFQNDRQRDVYEKIQAGRKRQRDEMSINFATIMKTVMFGGKSYISHTQILQMTMWQLLDAYQTIITIDDWKRNYPLLCVQIDPKGMDFTHWSNSIKI